MALEIKVYREITAYQSKVMLGMSWRQMACAALGLVLVGGTYGACIWAGQGDLGSWLAALLTMPFVAFGWIRPKGLPFERYAHYLWRYKWEPQRRLYAQDSSCPQRLRRKGRQMLFATKRSKNEAQSESLNSNSSDSNKRTRRRRKAKDVPRRKRNTSQQVLQYQALTDTGICVLGDGRYSVTLKLADIDYQLAPEDEQQVLVEQYAQFINSFDAGQSVQLTVLNRRVDRATLSRAVSFAPHGDGKDDYRWEYNDIINARLAGGRNNTMTDKYLTITVEADDFEHATTTLARIATEATAQLRAVGGCRAERVSGEERVRVLHEILRPGEPFRFTYSDLVGSTLTTKDYVAPWAIDFGASADSVTFVNEEDSYYQVLVLRELPSWLSDRLMKELSEINNELAISVHFRPLDHAEGLDLVKRQIAEMDMQRANELRKARKQGNGEESIPHELVASRDEAIELREQLESSNEKLFSTTIVVGVAGATREALSEAVEQVRVAGRKQSCTFETLRWMQEDGLNAVLPLGVCRLPIYRTLTTATVAVMVPFTTQELLDAGGRYYGVNAISKNLVVGSRSATMNGNAFILGTTGSGKSQFGKGEAFQTFLGTDDDIIIVDPEREYAPLGEAMGATTVEISAGSSACINPLHMERGVNTEDGSPIKLKAEFILSLCEVLIGGANGLTAPQRSIIDRCVTRIYGRFLQDKRAEPPTLGTLFEELRTQPEEEAHSVATALELYAAGSFNGFSQQTNVDTSNRVLIYDISQLGSDMKTFGMLVVLEQIWAQVQANRARGRRTWLYMDEFHLLFSNDYAGAYCQMIYKRARKYGLMPTGLTQNIEELLMSERARLMLANSDTLVLLNQTATDAATLQELFHWSDKHRSYFQNVAPGCGLLKMGVSMVPFDSRIATDTKLYKLYTTKFGEAA
ncbi:VirB4-like conjugal transfer ATPase, CD1110 family [Actinomyces ruminis]|uniref:PrgI family protein n=1 Tax=Actinomyces ruminis TaxID=1937003 RepID=A0ABX4MAK6_9ACTO|nr:PrgI family protein [Actinomyces ruminis]PHP52460.1 PrgI family protein [Actinomyces ruminis]